MASAMPARLRRNQIYFLVLQELAALSCPFWDKTIALATTKALRDRFWTASSSAVRALAQSVSRDQLYQMRWQW